LERATAQTRLDQLNAKNGGEFDTVMKEIDAARLRGDNAAVAKHYETFDKLQAEETRLKTRLGEAVPEAEAAKPVEPQGTTPEPDLHHSNYQPREEGKFAGPPMPPEDAKATAILEGKERALPKTLDAAQLEGGANRTYQPTSILGGSES